MSNITRDRNKLRAMSDAELFRWRREAREIMSKNRSKYLEALYEASNVEFCSGAQRAWSGTQ
jgi:hypothetical protein